MIKPKVLLLDQIWEDYAAELNARFPSLEFIDAREEAVRDRHFAEAIIMYGLPPIKRLQEAIRLRWIQLLSAGLSRTLRPKAMEQGITVTNLGNLYGQSIAEHTLALMSMLCRNLQIAMRNQLAHRWDNSIANTMTDLAGKTVAIIGLGNIGQSIGRLAQAYGMRVVGTRRTLRVTPFVDRVYPLSELKLMLAEADFVVVATPLIEDTENLLRAEEFAVMKRGVFYINVSRGAVADESALLAALESGHVAGAGLDVFAREPLPEDHPFWDMPQVIISPHYSGDTVNHSRLPLERFIHNLRLWSAGRPLEFVVNLDRGY